MATDLAKIQGYVPHEVYQKLLEFKDQRELKSISMATAAALEEFFGLAKGSSSVNHSELAGQVEAHEGKIASLTEQMEKLTQALIYKRPAVIVMKSSSPSSPVIESEGKSGSLLSEDHEPLVDQSKLPDVEAAQSDQTTVLIQAASESLSDQSELSAQSDSPVIQSELPSSRLKPMSERGLARRLKVHPKTLSVHKLRPTLEDWSRDRDPESRAWTYSVEAKMFYSDLANSVAE